VLSVRPGITDLASLTYRNESDLLAQSQDPERTYIEEILPHKLALSLQYIDQASFWGDLRLILKTVGVM
jgi:lipopolysaccharide/colanic/teichoic acid biosynthesis glycosyltransferase